jgi:hypothetical protein
MRKEFNTDKYEHGYIPIYETYFESMLNVENVLEIGIHNGESLKYLSSKFPNAKIYGLDIFSKTNYDNEKIKTFLVDQEDRNSIQTFLDETNILFDLIIDDGGHTMKQQQVSFGIFFPYLKNDGIYILEDLHTSRLSQYISENDLITTLDMLNNFQYTGNLISNHISDKENEYIKQNISSIRIWSRTSEYNQSVTSIIKKKI